MNKQDKELLLSVQDLAQLAAELRTERDMLRKENEYLKSLVDHLAARPLPNPNWTPNVITKPNTMGCSTCGLGADGKATGYVCYRTDCPTRVTC
jgi:hypothetical protein